MLTVPSAAHMFERYSPKKVNKCYSKCICEERDMGAVIKKWKTETQNFTENTTAHGVDRIGSRERPIWYVLN